MNKQFIFGTLTGAAAGAGIMFVAMREYFKAKAEAEVNEVREYYKSEYEAMRKDNDEVINNVAKAIKGKSEDDISEEAVEEPKSAAQKADEEYEEIKKRENYSQVSEDKKPKKEKKKTNRPYCVTPEHFAQEPGFSKVTLDYWNGNGVFTNIDGDIEPEAGVWIDFKNNNEFGVYEDDLLYVRNDQMNTDFEVMFHEESYEGEEDL